MKVCPNLNTPAIGRSLVRPNDTKLLRNFRGEPLQRKSSSHASKVMRGYPISPLCKSAHWQLWDVPIDAADWWHLLVLESDTSENVFRLTQAETVYIV